MDKYDRNAAPSAIVHMQRARRTYNMFVSHPSLLAPGSGLQLAVRNIVTERTITPDAAVWTNLRVRRTTAIPFCRPTTANESGRGGY
jgi:hypothetical protein